MKNWKTTFLGISTVIGGVAMIVKGQTVEGVTMVLAGITGIFSKDHDNRS